MAQVVSGGHVGVLGNRIKVHCVVFGRHSQVRLRDLVHDLVVYSVVKVTLNTVEVLRCLGREWESGLKG